MSIADKLVNIAENVPKVYAVGQESMIDRSKVIEKSATGNSIVSLNDVSEIPHNVGVKVESRNLFDVSKAVTISSNNTVSVSGDTVTIGLSSDGKAYGFKAPNDGEIEVGKTYTFSVGDVSEHESGYGFRFYYTDGTYEQTTRVPKTVTVEKEVKDILFYVGFYKVAFQNDIVVKQPQIELGDTATPYTEHVEDITRVEVRQYGKNLVSEVKKGIVDSANLPNITDTNSEIYRTVHLKGLKKGQYTFSFEKAIYVVRSQSTSEHSTNVDVSTTPQNNTKYTTITLTQDEEDYCLSFRANTSGEEWGNAWVQCELGTQATPYEPCQGHTFTPNADGVVEGVKSISPTMHIMTDKAVDITVDYWKSYGMQTEYDRFWDSYQDYGNRTHYTCAFAGYGWNDETFLPKYDIIVTSSGSAQMFRTCQMTNLKKTLEELGVKLDTSKAVNLEYFLYWNAVITHVPMLDFSNVTNANYGFSNCKLLHTIDELISNANLKWNNTFQECRALTNLKISGVIGQNGFDVSYSPLLTVESLLSILTALSKDSTLASGKTVTFATASYDVIRSGSATMAQLSQATYAGWTVSYIER